MNNDFLKGIKFLRKDKYLGTVVSKIKSNDKTTKLGTLAVKISANYIF